MNTANTPKKIPLAYFLVPLLIQLGIILLIPSKSFSTYKTGQDVVIQTRPVDPYDFLRGYSQTLSYDISNLVNSDLERGSENRSDRRRPFVVSIKVGKDGHSVPVSLWLGDRYLIFN